MSRIGKLPVKIPQEVKVTLDGKKIKFDNGKVVKDYTIRPNVEIDYSDSTIKLCAKNQNKSYSIDVGMDRSNIDNIVKGLIKPFEINLEVNGVGYKASVNQNIIILSLGFSHEIFYALPKDVDAIFEKPNKIILKSHDKVLVGQVASEIIAFRKPEPYKGKGVMISGSKIVRKEGKKK